MNHISSALQLISQRFDTQMCTSTGCGLVFLTFVEGWRPLGLALFISVSSSSDLWCRACATAGLHLHGRGVGYWALIAVLIYMRKPVHHFSYKHTWGNTKRNIWIQLSKWRDVHNPKTDPACPSFQETNCFLESSPLIRISPLWPSSFYSSVQQKRSHLDSDWKQVANFYFYERTSSAFESVTGTHLKIRSEVSPTVTHFFSLRSIKQQKVLRYNVTCSQLSVLKYKPKCLILECMIWKWLRQQLTSEWHVILYHKYLKSCALKFSTYLKNKVPIHLYMQGNRSL